MNLIEVSFFLRFGYIHSQSTAGHLATFVPKMGITDVQFPPRNPTLTNELIQLLSKILLRNVSADPKPAVFLSGGIDSPLIAALAQSMTSQPLKAFTFSTQDAQTDETEQAIKYAQEIGLEHHIVSLDTNQLPELILELLPLCDEPPGDYSIIPTYLVCREAKKYADVILSGDGGDELFWGYASRMSRVIRLAPLFRLPKWQRKLRWWLLRRPYEWNTRYFDTVGDWYRSSHEHNFESDLKQIFPTLPSISDELSLYDFNGVTQDETAYWTRWNECNGHVQAGLTKVRMASSVAGIKVESPLLDEDMVRFAAGLDWRTCLEIDEEIGKLPLRAMLQQFVSSPSIRKLGFSVPMGSWLRGPLREMFETYVLNRESLMGLEIRREAMRTAFDAHLDGTRENAWGLWIFLSLAIWEDTHKGKMLEA